MGLIPMLGAGYLANEYAPEIESLYNRWGPEAVQGVGQSGVCGPARRFPP